MGSDKKAGILRALRALERERVLDFLQGVMEKSWRVLRRDNEILFTLQIGKSGYSTELGLVTGPKTGEGDQ